MCPDAGHMRERLGTLRGKNNSQTGATMFTTFRTTAIGAALGLCVGLVPPAQAAYVVSLQQVGANVDATGGGPIDLFDLSFSSSAYGVGGGIVPNIGMIATGPFSLTDAYIGFAGPASFGSGSGYPFASSGSGELVSIVELSSLLSAPSLFVPAGYNSGSSLSDSSTYDNATFASLGATPGTYEWTWGSGVHADSFTLQIGVAAVPEPASLTVLAMGLAGLGPVLRLRRA